MSETTRQHQRTNDSAVVVTVLKLVIAAVFLYPLIHYTVLKSENVKQPPFQQIPEINESLPVEVPKIKPKIIEQPSCPSSYIQVILTELCEELIVRREKCTPDDVNNLEKHKLPRPAAKNSTTSEPRGTIVGCLAAGLLMTSLGAAFVELYKAKAQTPAKAKPPMSRKCSLADLTVLKHNRKELVRRESILEIPENGGGSSKLQLGFRPPPLNRRCSFPVGPGEFSQRLSYGSYSPESRRTSIDSRRLSVIDSRRSSIDSRKTSICDGRRISMDSESPDRRHWTRLVHRH